MKSYLKDRIQIVNITRDGKQHYSQAQKIEQGVPQGSILGPLLFLLYVNNLCDGIAREHICQYADDTSVVLADRTLDSLSVCCSGTAEWMMHWCEQNSLRLNADKTGLIQFSKSRIRNESLFVRLNGRSIRVVDSVKFLGMHVDSTLSWETHISVIQSKMNSACALIRRLRECIAVGYLRTFYFSYIQSRIKYGIIFWGSSKDAIKVFRAQKRVVRCILKLRPRESCRTHFTHLDILTVPSLYYLSLVMFVKNSPELFPRNDHFHAGDMSVVTRGRAELSIPAHSTTFYKRGPFYRAIEAYRSLPSELRAIEDISKFKRAVMVYLRQKCFYTFNF